MRDRAAIVVVVVVVVAWSVRLVTVTTCRLTPNGAPLERGHVVGKPGGAVVRVARWRRGPRTDRWPRPRQQARPKVTAPTIAARSRMRLTTQR